MAGFFPSSKEWVKKAALSTLVPVCYEFVADLDTPLTLFTKISEGRDSLFLFESLEGGERWGRYSFIGYDPLVSFTSRGSEFEIHNHCNAQSTTTTGDGNPLAEMKKMVESLDAADFAELPPFSGGAVGYLGYEMVRFMENLPCDKTQLNLPDSSLIIPRVVLAHDRLRQVVTVIYWVYVEDKDNLETQYLSAQSDIAKIVADLKKPMPTAIFSEAEKGLNYQHQFTSNFSKEEFCAMVERAKEYIYSGDIIQVVLSQRFETTTTIDPLLLYRALRHINPSPYLFFLKLGDVIQIGSSPEILVKKQGKFIDLRPIAGTRKRGVTVEDDIRLEAELLADPKECAEHLMLVDLGRNDLGRVSQPGKVEVNDLLTIERYSHVMHIVSGVRGEIADNCDQFDVVNASFPAGTVSGAPKIRAMEIIDELEPERRGAYAGSVGYFGFSGNMDFCITIRTYILQGDKLWVQAGAGIVADSVPQLEYEETISKSMALRRALELVEQGF